MLPRHDYAADLFSDQRPGTLGQSRVLSKERLDAPRAGLPQSGDDGPPTAPARHADGQIRQGGDAGGPQRGDCTSIQPQRHVITDDRLWQSQRPEQLDRLVGCPALFGAFGRWYLEQHREVFALTLPCQYRELAPDATKHAA
ncbi:hypothetical protein KR96_21025 [Ralstonia solanacearum]|nr:hypothetical protein KR96_21025 [Ralstonia solanacearum]